MDPVAIVMRWAHMIGALMLVGGITYYAVVVLPALSGLADEQKKELQASMRGRWARIVMFSTLRRRTTSR